MVLIKKFEDIETWKKARQLTNRIYEISCNNEFSNDFSLKGQIRKASRSIMLNIAEGYGRKSNTEFRRFLDYAHGSCAEVQSALYIALDQNCISKQQFYEINENIDEISRMITGFSIYLRNRIDKQKTK
jgi:four helix bundle protein